MSKPRVAPNYVVLRARTNSEWMELLSEIKDPTLKMKVASIVWWDWFSREDRICIRIRTLVRNFPREKDYEISDVDVYHELIRLGYVEDIAQKRSRYTGN